MSNHQSSPTNLESDQVTSTVSLDVSQDFGIGPAPLSGRESHTSDIELFESKLYELKTMSRALTDSPYHDGLWTFIGELLAQCQEPTGFQDLEDSAQVAPKGLDDIASIAQRITTLALLNPIYPYRLAEASGYKHTEVLTELLYATKIGMMHMKWAPECTRCGSSLTD